MYVALINVNATNLEIDSIEQPACDSYDSQQTQ